jgi:hypothetical protein
MVLKPISLLLDAISEAKISSGSSVAKDPEGKISTRMNGLMYGKLVEYLIISTSAETELLGV